MTATRLQIESELARTDLTPRQRQLIEAGQFTPSNQLPQDTLAPGAGGFRLAPQVAAAESGATSLPLPESLQAPTTPIVAPGLDPNNHFDAVGGISPTGGAGIQSPALQPPQQNIPVPNTQFGPLPPPIRGQNNAPGLVTQGPGSNPTIGLPQQLASQPQLQPPPTGSAPPQQGLPPPQQGLPPQAAPNVGMQMGAPGGHYNQLAQRLARGG